MDYKVILGIVSALAAIAQYVPYIADILRRKTRPHAFSWFVWGLPCGIVYAAQLMNGGGAGSWATGFTTIFCTVIFVFSLFRGEKDITRLDCFCLFLALAAIGLWIITQNPLGSVILVTVADILGFVPTFRKSLLRPHEETASTPFVGNIKWLFALCALDSYSVTTCLYPVAMLFANGLLFAVLMTGRKNARIASQPGGVS